MMRALFLALALSACAGIDIIPAETEAKIKAVACQPGFDGDWEALLGRPLGERERTLIAVYRATECPELVEVET